VSSPTQKVVRYRFGPFELAPAEARLSRGGTPVKLQDLPYRLLLMLVERAGEIVTREELRQRLWPENTFVEFDNSLGVAIRKVRESLNDDAEAPRYVETVPRRGYRFLGPVAADGVLDLEDPLKAKQAGTESSPMQPASAATTLPRRRRYWVVAALVLMMVGATIYTFRSVPQRAPATAEARGLMPPIRVRRSVAVLGFRNLSGRPDDNWLSSAFSEMLNTELAAGGELRLVSGEDVARVKRELPLVDEDSLSKATLNRLRTSPGADVVVLGSYMSLPDKGEDQIRLDVRLQDTAAGETIAEEAFTGDEHDLFDLAAQAGLSLRQSLGVRAESPQAAGATRAALPSNERAARLYAEGRAKEWAYDFAGARDLLLEAVAADPNFPLAHAALSETWWQSGYESKARAEGLRAQQLSAHLSQEQRLLVDGQYERVTEDWPKAVETYQSLFHLFPDSLDYGLLLASTQYHIRPADAMQTLAELRRLPPPTGDDARIDMLQASVQIDTDFNQARAAALRAIQKASAQGSHVLVARTYGILCQQGPAIGATDQSINDCEKALQSEIAAGDRDGEAMMRNNLAALYFFRGDVARSEAMFREAVRAFRQVGNPDGIATSLSNWGTTRMTQGSLEEARKLLKESIPDYQQVEDKDGVALALTNLGDVSRQTGDLDVAATTYQQAKATAQEINDNDAMGYVLNSLGDLFMDRGDLTAARQSYQEALALRRQAGEGQLAAETELALARLALEDGHPADAAASASKCKEQFRHDKQADDELTASTVLIEALLSQNKPGDAQEEMEAAQPLATKSQNELLRLRFALVSARMLLVLEHPESSRKLLDQVAQGAREHGFVGLELEDRLAIAELTSKTGNVALAREKLAALERAARAKGFGLIAAKASKLGGARAAAISIIQGIWARGKKTTSG